MEDVKKSEFSLRHVVTDVLDSTTLTDPSDVAAEVLRRIPDDAHGEALAQSLRQFVRLVMNAGRTVAEGEDVKSKNPSRKVAAIRKAWQAQLNNRVFTEGGWKLLRDCTKRDLLFLAEERRRVASENVAAAERYERLATVVGSGTVGDLDNEILDDTLGKAA